MAEVEKMQVYNTKYLARLFKNHPQTITRWLKSGKIQGKKIGRRWFIKRETIDALLN